MNFPGRIAEVPAPIPITRGGSNIESNTDAREHVDQPLAIERFDVPVSEIAGPRLGEFEHMHERALAELIIADNAEEHIEELLTGAEVRGRPHTDWRRSRPATSWNLDDDHDLGGRVACDAVGRRAHS